ncbi:unnamed protein product [Linum trigynum]|uniref:TF-B3 domain-containing protein n=1 Tax=Linum trigynum TaxID=586398 RepID=A0AAV2E3I5_9ROSI
MFSQTPSFIKVLVGCFSMKLRIPDSFIYAFGQDLDGKVTLKPNAGTPAVVSVEWGSRGCFFGAGWPSFVDDNGLQEGDYLVFNFTGSETVDVVIYDPTGCVKRIEEVQTSKHCPGSARNRETEPSPENPRNGMGKEGKREAQTRMPERNLRTEQLRQTTRPLRSSRRSFRTEQLPQTSKRMAKGSELNPQEAPIKTEPEEGYFSGDASQGLDACFQVVYKKYMEFNVCIPLRFCTIARLEMKDSVQLQDPSGRVWPVALIAGGGRRRSSKRFGSGWPAFAAANSVAFGDRIDFHYKPELGVFQVEIHKPKNNTCNDSETGKRPWKRSDGGNHERSKLFQSYGWNSETEKLPKPRKGLQRKRGAPAKTKFRKGHSSGNNASPGLADSYQAIYKKHMKRSNYMCMPTRFSEATKLSQRKTAQLEDPRGKVWTVSVISIRNGRQRRFSRGWPALAAANGLAVGDGIEFTYKPDLDLIQVKIHKRKSNAGNDSEI